MRKIILGCWCLFSTPDGKMSSGKMFWRLYNSWKSFNLPLPFRLCHMTLLPTLGLWFFFNRTPFERKKNFFKTFFCNLGTSEMKIFDWQAPKWFESKSVGILQSFTWPESLKNISPGHLKDLQTPFVSSPRIFIQFRFFEEPQIAQGSRFANVKIKIRVI